MISGFDSSAEGTTHVYVEYKGKQVVYSMEVVAPKTSDISSIVISGQPKKSYVEGEVFNPSRASMYATIGGRAAYIYSGFTYDKTGPLKPRILRLLLITSEQKYRGRLRLQRMHQQL